MKSELSVTSGLPPSVSTISQRSTAINLNPNTSKDTHVGGPGAQVEIRPAASTAFIATSASSAVVQTAVSNLKAELSSGVDKAAVGRAPVTRDTATKQSETQAKPANSGNGVVNQSAVNSLKADLLAVKAAPVVETRPELPAPPSGTESNQVFGYYLC